MRFCESLWKLMKVIFSVQSLTFVPFCSIAMFYWNFIISYCVEQNLSVCYHTVLPIGNIGKDFAIVKRKVIFPILQILTRRSNVLSLPFKKTYLVRPLVSTLYYSIYVYGHSNKGSVGLGAWARFDLVGFFYFLLQKFWDRQIRLEFQRLKTHFGAVIFEVTKKWFF